MKITRRQLRKMIQEAILKEQERALDDQDAERREIIRKYKVAIDWFQNTLFPAIASDFVDGPVEVVALATQNGISGIPVALTDDDDVDTIPQVASMLKKGLTIKSPHQKLPVFDVISKDPGVVINGPGLTAEELYNGIKREVWNYGYDDELTVPDIPQEALAVLHTSDALEESAGTNATLRHSARITRKQFKVKR